MEVFQDYAYYYNAFYSDKNYRVEAERVVGLLKKYGRNIRKIINFGCGTGRHDIEFAKMGYGCTGLDISEHMIRNAVNNAEKARLKINFSKLRTEGKV